MWFRSEAAACITPGGNVCSKSVDRSHELEIIRRSVAMLTPGQHALRREDALYLIEELARLTKRLDELRSGLRRLVDEDDAVARHPTARLYGHRREGPG